MSIDTKKEYIGNLYRAGKLCLITEVIEVLDHDLPGNLASGGTCTALLR
jgi:hypothetical protein